MKNPKNISLTNINKLITALNELHTEYLETSSEEESARLIRRIQRRKHGNILLRINNHAGTVLAGESVQSIRDPRWSLFCQLGLQKLCQEMFDKNHKSTSIS